jgi:prolyl oligopeptidase
MRLSPGLLCILLLSPSLCVVALHSQSAPPAAPVNPVVDDYYGTKIVDPYRYMEDVTSPQVKDFLKTQGDYTRTRLDAIPGRENLLEQLVAAIDASPAVYDSLTRRGERIFYRKREPHTDSFRLYVRTWEKQDERLLFDPDKDAVRGTHKVLLSFTPSWKGDLVTISTASGGSESGTIHVLDVPSGKQHGDTITRNRFLKIAWLPDDSGFLYNRLQEMRPGMDPAEVYKNSTILLHILGENPAKDRLIVSPELMTYDRKLIPLAYITEGSPFVILELRGVANNTARYFVRLTDLTNDAPLKWVKLTDPAENVFDVAIHRSDAYLSTSMGATRFRVLQVNLAALNGGARDVVIEEQPNAFIGEGTPPIMPGPPKGPGVGLHAAQDALYVSYMQDGLSRLMRMPYAAKEKRIEFLDLPASGVLESVSAETSLPGVVYSWSTWTAPPRRFYADGKQTKPILVDEAVVSADEAKLITVEEVVATGKDGTTIPLTILYRAGMAMDGSHPLMLRAYGAYGISSSPAYSPSWLVWVRRGYIVAVAHVRGGGERGEPWHLAGDKGTKHNTWEDAIACAEYLDAHKYTSPAHTAIWGGSAGGIVVGRSITERPDLFAAAIDVSPASDMLRLETEPNGPPNIPEFGSTKTEDGFKALYAMSPYEHIRPGTKYPGVLLLTGANDPRVSPAQPAKMSARLQAATASGRPVLLRVDYDAGHNPSTMTTRQTAEAYADFMSFALWQTGVPDFQPTSK